MPKEFFTGDLISALADDEPLFDVMHSSAENSSPMLGFMHDSFDVTLSRLDIPDQNLGAMQIGFKTFEILSSLSPVDAKPPITINEHALRVMTQAPKVLFLPTKLAWVRLSRRELWSCSIGRSVSEKFWSSRRQAFGNNGRRSFQKSSTCHLR